MFTNGNGPSQPISGNVQGRIESMPVGQYPVYPQQASMNGSQVMPPQPNWSTQQDSINQCLFSH